ncbi:dipeptidyl aminopeptidase 6 isoform X1 [Labeo rohita]|uniref:Dipeptidyl aminopeptidase 6 isoform X1 n=1 Tax=Labeo rohita TaxID=84645 RepID=A0A498N7Q0_LABRO|nr:dipeptidyl aminopeptidase 6 isoform X1 [Labeo rohita]
MASLYQRFTGKINTNKSFPHPPEASHLLGGQVPDEENKAGKSPHHPSSRPQVQYRKRNACEDEDAVINGIKQFILSLLQFVQIKATSVAGIKHSADWSRRDRAG